MPAPAALRALLAHAVDYAGLFPPANLALEPALGNYASYIREPDSWMLGAFVLPSGKFEDAISLMSPFDTDYVLRLSALGPKSENAREFMSALKQSTEAIRMFNLSHGAIALITQIEMSLPSQPGVHLAEANAVLADLQIPTFWETPADEAERVIEFLAERRRTGTGRFGYKLRTGGVVASAFPSSVQIARALVAAVRGRVPIKFTAGLHHPVRKFHPKMATKMHGFLNVLGAGVLAAEHEWDVQQTARMLEDEDPTSFTIDDDTFTWDTWSVSTKQIAAHRKIVTSFGSCSFDEPRDDLRELGLF